MPISLTPQWQQLALYAVAAAVLLMLLQRIPVVGRVIRLALTAGLLALSLFLLMRQAPYEPHLAGLSERLGLDRQEVVGKEVRIRMASDGHFWADVTVNGVKRRMLIDSGATVTALSERTAGAASIEPEHSLVPVVLKTANGLAQARTGTVGELRVGNTVARRLKVVISPAFGDMDVIGMNFLTKLASWRVEGRTLVLTPHHPQAAGQEKGR
ncbi:MAG: TIGR02281 family clan AA aspartic protease [Alphaproteobacteria bacterium]|nr:TIGR02281 family clan AA aspartic protease [Alphaproteobacteria bacterium]MBV9372173.1 TIGR02281 family clan AA aspartic protease [Alphaproteobacteria bacterium]MBV9902304.1 TIGR02281 family clan AA aspartic protease [Alphaproteobacteria bacterium]